MRRLIGNIDKHSWIGHKIEIPGGQLRHSWGTVHSEAKRWPGPQLREESVGHSCVGAQDEKRSD